MNHKSNKNTASCILPVKSGRSKERVGRNTLGLPNLRPPTLMIDLLFGALMLFAFQMGNPNSQSITPHEIELPTSDVKAPRKGDNVLVLKPVRINSSTWLYEQQDGTRLRPLDVQVAVKEKKVTPVLLIAGDTSLTKAIAAQSPLRILGVQPGLAVALTKGEKK